MRFNWFNGVLLLCAGVVYETICSLFGIGGTILSPLLGFMLGMLWTAIFPLVSYDDC